MRLSPGACIGIVGGGQLGRMTALAAARLGYRCHVFTPEADSPAAQVTNRATVAAYDDLEALERFGRAVDVVTIEFENLPVEPLAGSPSWCRCDRRPQCSRSARIAGARRRFSNGSRSRSPPGAPYPMPAIWPRRRPG